MNLNRCLENDEVKREVNRVGTLKASMCSPKDTEGSARDAFCTNFWMMQANHWSFSGWKGECLTSEGGRESAKGAE